MRHAIFFAFLLVLYVSGALPTPIQAEDNNPGPANSSTMPAGYPTSVAEAIDTANQVSRSAAILTQKMQQMMNANIGATPAELNQMGIFSETLKTQLASCQVLLSGATGADKAALENNIEAAITLLEELDTVTKKLADRGTLI